MADVFVSYSRSDGEFARELAAALEERGREPWLDVEGIEDGEVFPAALRRAIEETDGMVFVISPEGADSPFCQQEVDHALSLGKRIVPVLHREAPDESLPDGIRERQWVDAGERVSPEAADRLTRALDADPEHTREHTRLLVRARDWDARGRRSAALPRGDELADAESWLTQAQGRDPAPIPLQAEWIAAGRAAASRRQRRLVAGAAVFGLVALGLVIFALVSRNKAEDAKASARSRALAEVSLTQVKRDPQRALLLAREGLADSPTSEAKLAVSAALDANTARSQLPSFGAQGCQEANFLFLFDRGRTAVDNTCDGYLIFADIPRRKIVKRLRIGRDSTDMVLSRSGRGLLVAAENKLFSVDVQRRRVRHLYTAPFRIVQLAGPPEKYIAIADKDKVGLVDLEKRRTRVIARGDSSVNVINGMMPADSRRVIIAALGQTRGSGNLFPGLTVLDVTDGTRETVNLSTPSRLAAVNFLRVSPDQRTWFITGSEINAHNDEQVAATWAIDARSRRVRWTARGPLGAVASPVQASPDGKLVAVGYSQGATDVLDVATGRLVVREASSAGIGAGDMVFSPRGNTLVTVALDGVIRTWSTRGSERLRLQAPAAPAVDFTPDGKNLVFVGERGEIIDRGSGRTVRRFAGFPAKNLFATCNAACFATSPQLRWLTYVDVEGSKFRIRKLDGRTGRHVSSVTVPRLDSQGVAPDGRIAAVWVDDDRYYAQIIDPRSGRRRTLPHSQSSDGCAATTPSFTPDSRLMATVDGCTHATVWDLRSGRVKRSIELPDRASGSPALLSPDGRYVVVAVLGGGLARVDVGSGKTEVRPGGQTEGKAIAVSPDGRYYAIGRLDGTVDEYDARSLRLVRRHLLDAAIQSLVFSPDGRELAVEDTRNVLRIWDTCDVCQDAKRLSKLAAERSVRKLTPGERAAFEVK